MPSLGPLHTVVFDLDDTLYPEREFVRSGFKAVGNWLNSHHRVQGFSSIAGALFDAGNRGDIFNAALLQVGLSPSPDLIAQMVTVYRDHVPTLGLASTVASFLEWAKLNFRLALISDGYLEVQRRKFKILGLGDWIPVAVFPDTMGRSFWKPHPWAFEEVMRIIPGPANGFLYIGDNPRKDFVGARGVGWKTARLRVPGQEHADFEPPANLAPDLEIYSLGELRTILSGSTPP